MTQAQRSKWEASMDKKLDPNSTTIAMDRRLNMTRTQKDPLMTTGAGTLPIAMPGAPGSLLDDTMGPMYESAYQAPPLDLER